MECYRKTQRGNLNTYLLNYAIHLRTFQNINSMFYCVTPLPSARGRDELPRHARRGRHPSSRGNQCGGVRGRVRLDVRLSGLRLRHAGRFVLAAHLSDRVHNLQGETVLYSLQDGGMLHNHRWGHVTHTGRGVCVHGYTCTPLHNVNEFSLYCVLCTRYFQFTLFLFYIIYSQVYIRFAIHTCNRRLMRALKVSFSVYNCKHLFNLILPKRRNNATLYLSRHSCKMMLTVAVSSGTLISVHLAKIISLIIRFCLINEHRLP